MFRHVIGRWLLLANSPDLGIRVVFPSHYETNFCYEKPMNKQLFQFLGPWILHFRNSWGKFEFASPPLKYWNDFKAIKKCWRETQNNFQDSFSTMKIRLNNDTPWKSSDSCYLIFSWDFHHYWDFHDTEKSMKILQY